MFEILSTPMRNHDIDGGNVFDVHVLDVPEEGDPIVFDRLREGSPVINNAVGYVATVPTTVEHVDELGGVYAIDRGRTVFAVAGGEATVEKTVKRSFAGLIPYPFFDKRLERAQERAGRSVLDYYS